MSITTAWFFAGRVRRASPQVIHHVFTHRGGVRVDDHSRLRRAGRIDGVNRQEAEAPDFPLHAPEPFNDIALRFGAEVGDVVFGRGDQQRSQCIGQARGASARRHIDRGVPVPRQQCGGLAGFDQPAAGDRAE
jgi:hypothetical protein